MPIEFPILRHRKLPNFKPAYPVGTLTVFRKIIENASHGVQTVEHFCQQLVIFDLNSPFSLIVLVKMFSKVFRIAEELFNSKSVQSFNVSECYDLVVNMSAVDMKDIIQSLCEKGTCMFMCHYICFIKLY